MFTDFKDNFHYVVVIVLALVGYHLLRKSIGKGSGLNVG